jgi:hypothetical protein
MDTSGSKLGGVIDTAKSKLSGVTDNPTSNLGGVDDTAMSDIAVVLTSLSQYIAALLTPPLSPTQWCCLTLLNQNLNGIIDIAESEKKMLCKFITHLNALIFFIRTIKLIPDKS